MISNWVTLNSCLTRNVCLDTVLLIYTTSVSNANRKFIKFDFVKDVKKQNWDSEGIAIFVDLQSYSLKHDISAGKVSLQLLGFGLAAVKDEAY